MMLTAEEQIIFNAGERLIPGRSHDYTEVRRHYGSYLFFKEIIEYDQKMSPAPGGLSIVDLGCGVGHGCKTLSEIAGARVLGVDVSEESLAYARRHYDRPSITWQQSDLIAFVESMQSFDYVVSRGVLEHIPNGIDLAVNARWRRRIMFDVPYAEPRGGNPHHVLNDITEKDFERFDDAELFFQDLGGVMFRADQKPEHPNMILCACRKRCHAAVNELISTWPFEVDWSDYGPEAQQGSRPSSTAGVNKRRGLMARVMSLIRGKD